MALTFYPEGTTVLPGDGELRTLHKIAALTAGGGGGAGTLWRYWEDANVSDDAPPDPTQAVERRFLNGDPPVVWNPDLSQWL